MGKSVDFEECRLEVENKPLSTICLSDESDDSDQLQLFELPNRKIVRPSSKLFKKKIGTSKNSFCSKTGLCCKVCFATIIPIFLVTFVFATVTCFAVLMNGVSGIKAELDGLKIRLSNAEDAEKDFNMKRDHLRTEFRAKLEQLTQHEARVKEFQSTIEKLELQLHKMNVSIVNLRNHPSLNVVSIKQDLDKLKTGMADTGSDISKLQGTHNTLSADVKLLRHQFGNVKEELFNATVKISQLENKPPPERSTTPKTLVVTLTADKNEPVKRKEFEEELANLRHEQKQLCEEESSGLRAEFENLRNQTTKMNFTYQRQLSKLANRFESKESENSSDISDDEEDTRHSGKVLNESYVTTYQPPTVKPTSADRSNETATVVSSSTTTTTTVSTSTTLPISARETSRNISARKGADDSSMATETSTGSNISASDSFADNSGVQKLLDALRKRKRTAD